MKTIYMTRHGQTQWNVEKRMQGRKDSPLTETGRDQASRLGKRLLDITIDKVYASPSGRTVDTAKIIIGDRNIPLITDERLLELSIGVWEGKDFAYIEENYKEQHHAFWHDTGKMNLESVETFQEIMDRTRSFIEDVLEDDADTVLLVSHGVTVNALLTAWNGRKPENFWGEKSIQSTSLSIVEIDEELNGHIVLYADTAHLE